MAGDIESLPGRSRAGSLAVRDLRKAFDELSKSGQISFHTFETWAVQLTRISPVAGVAGLAVVELAKGVKYLYDQTQIQAKADLATLLEGIATEAKSTKTAWDAYYAAIIKGADDADAALEKHLAEDMTVWTNERAAGDKRIQAIQDGVAKEETAIAQLEERKRRALTFEIQGSAQYVAFQQKYDAMIATHNAAIKQDKIDSEAIYKSLGDEAKARRIVITADNDQITSLKDLHKERAQDLADMADVIDKLVKMYSLAGDEHAKAPDVSSYMSAVADVTGAIGGMSEATADYLDNSKRAFLEVGSMIAQQLSRVAVPAFDLYTNALYNMTHAHQVASGTIIKALKEQVKASVKAIGEDASVKAVYEGAMALASLAVRDTEGAALHAQAAAEFGITAAVAGVAAAALGVTGVAPGAGGAPGAGAGGTGGGSGGAGPTINVTVIGQLDAAAAEDLHDQLARAAQQRSLN